MSVVSARRLSPFLATHGCRRLFTSTRATFSPRKRGAVESPRHTADKLIRDHGGPSTLSRPEGDPADDDRAVWDLHMLRKLLHQGTEASVAKYIPLEAAAEIVATLQSIPEGHATPPDVITKVLSIAERADTKFQPWPAVALHSLALSLIRPGETPNSEHNGELIARLLHIAAVHSGQIHYGPSLILLLGQMRIRGGGDPILLTDYSVDARQDYARFITDSDYPLRELMLDRTIVLLRRQSDPCKRDALLRSYVESLETAYNQQHTRVRDTKKRIRASFFIAQVYAAGEGHGSPWDGQLAKLWWERTLCLGLSTVGLDYGPVSLAAWNLARHYLSKPDRKYNDKPWWTPDFTRGFRYLRLAKWSIPQAALLLGSLYYLDPQSDCCKTIKDHISLHGVIPDDTLAAEAFYIGGERLADEPCKHRLASMLYSGRAHPPVDPTAIKRSSFAPRIPVPQLAPDVDWTVEELEKGMEQYESDNNSVIKFAPRSRLETLEYAWELVKPRDGTDEAGHAGYSLERAKLRQMIREEMRRYQ